MTSIFVGNLSFESTEADIRSSFEHYGRVSAVRIMTDRSTGRSRGFAFVNMPSIDDADEAINRLNGATVSGRRISVNEARSRDEQNQPGGGGPGRRSTLLDAMCAGL